MLHPHPTHPSHTCLLNLSRSPSPCSVHTVQFHNLRNILVATLPRVYLPDGFTPDEAHPNTNCSIGQVWGCCMAETRDVCILLLYTPELAVVCPRMRPPKYHTN